MAPTRKTHTHSAATIKHILFVLVSDTVWSKCQQATILLSVRPSWVCWTMRRKPEVWAQSAGHSSQHHSSHHWAPPTVLLLTQQHIQNIACHIQIGKNRGLSASLPGAFMAYRINLILCNSWRCAAFRAMKWYFSILRHTVHIQPPSFSLWQAKHSPLSHDDNGPIKDFFTAWKPWQRPA